MVLLRVWADVCGSCYYQRPCRYLRPCWCLRALLPWGPYWYGWPVLPPRPWWHLSPGCFWQPCLDSWSCCSWDLCWCLWPVSPKVVIETIPVEIWRPYWTDPALHSPCTIWLYLSWESAPTTLGIDGPTLHHRHGWSVPEAQTYWPAQLQPDNTLSLRLAHFNIYPFMTCWIMWKDWSCAKVAIGTPWQQQNILEKFLWRFRDDYVPEDQTNDSSQWTFAGGAVWKNGIMHDTLPFPMSLGWIKRYWRDGKGRGVRWAFWFVCLLCFDFS